MGSRLIVADPAPEVPPPTGLTIPSDTLIPGDALILSGDE